MSLPAIPDGDLAAKLAEAQHEIDALRARERDLASQLEQTAIAVINVSLRGDLTYVNARMASMLGYSREELVGRHVGRITHPDDLFVDREQILGVLAQGARFATADKRYVRKDGTSVWCHVTVTMRRDERGEPRDYVGSIEQLPDRPATWAEVREGRAPAAAPLGGREAMLALVFDHTSELLSLIGLDAHDEWRVVSINEPYLSTLERFGVQGARQRIEGSPLRKVMGEVLGYEADRLETAMARYELVRRTRAPLAFDQRTTFPGGDAYSEVTIIPIPDAQGEVTRILWTARDVTARRRAENALTASEQQFRQLAENIREVFWIVEPGTRRTLYVSPAFSEVWGRPGAPIEAVSAARLEGVHPADRASLERMLDASERGEPAGAEYRVLRPDGSERHVRDQGSPVRDEQGRLARIVGIAVDVTEEKLAAERLRRSEERFHRMLQAGWDVIALSQADGSFSFVGGNVTGIYGSTPEELAKLGVIDIVHPDDRERHAGFRRALLATPGSRQRLEFRVRRKDGRYTWIEVAAVNLLDDPAVRGVLSSSRDISMRKRFEEELSRLNGELEVRVAERTAELRRVNAALESASRAKDEFLAAMSHELRTPLNAVLGLSEALHEGVYGPVEHRQQRALRRIDESGRHLLSLINDILDLSKIEAGRMAIELSDVPVDEVCRSSIRMVQEAAYKKHQRVALSVDAGFATLRADERRLTQILVNLLSNAVKFTPDGGALGLEVEVDEAAEAVRFTVWDTGIGIAPEEQMRLFQPFVQLDSSLSRRHAGTGLGLALVRKLVDLHGGSIGLTSAAGGGARFTVTLPRQRASAEALARLTPAGGILRLRAGGSARERIAGPRRVLLADDDEVNLATFSDYLETLGYAVSVARNGREAIDLAREERPDVVVMDVQMPVLDGLAAIRALRAEADAALAAVPVIAVTALAMAGDRERCLEAGAHEYLTKPVSLRRLSDAIQLYMT